MSQAKYEVRSRVPAMGAAIPGLLLAMLAALVVSLVLPASGWSPRDVPVSVWGFELFQQALDKFDRGFPFWALDFDLRHELKARIVAILLSGVIGGWMAYRAALAATPLTDLREHYDGPQLLVGQQANTVVAEAMRARLRRRETFIQLAPGICYPRQWRVLNLLISGAIGSGKTRIILWLIEQCLAEQKRGSRQDHALFIHDTTGEILDGLPAMPKEFAALHPHKPGGWAWAAGRDLVTAEDIEEAADQAIGATQEAVWGKGASTLFAGCMMAARGRLNRSWGMPEIYDVAMGTPEEMRAAFEQHYPEAARLIVYDASGDLSRTTVSLLLTFRASVLRTLRPLAAAWRDHPANRMFSFRDWVHQSNTRQPGTVVVQRSGRHPSLSALWIGMAIDSIATYAGDEAFEVSQTRTRTLVLDELPALGRLRKLPELLDTGRNKGFATIAAIQDFAQLDRIYGKAAPSLKNRFLLKIIGAQAPGPDLMTIATKEIGTRRVIDKLQNKAMTSGPQGRSAQTSDQQQISETPIVPATYLAERLGVNGKSVKAVLVGLGDVAELTWPVTVWKKRR